MAEMARTTIRMVVNRKRLGYSADVTRSDLLHASNPWEEVERSIERTFLEVIELPPFYSTIYTTTHNPFLSPY